MFESFHKVLDYSILDNSIRLVLLTGGARGFCAGGDLKHFISPSGGWKFATAEYSLDRKINRLPLPFLSVLDGVVMGGGVGVSVHGRYRIVTDKTTWAMPEVTVGFLVDVGSTHFLARCPGYTGLYLALTGIKVHTSDAMYIGVGTHYVPSQKIAALLTALRECDISTPYKLEKLMNDFCEEKPPRLAGCVLQDNRDAIDRCFNASSIEEIIVKLEKESKSATSTWAENTIKILKHNCPTSLKVTMEAIKRAKDMTLEEAFSMELRVGTRLVARQDIQEGVRVVLVDKNRNTRPTWDPARLEDVPYDLVMSFFKPFDDPTMELDFGRQYT